MPEAQRVEIGTHDQRRDLGGDRRRLLGLRRRRRGSASSCRACRRRSTAGQPDDRDFRCRRPQARHQPQLQRHRRRRRRHPPDRRRLLRPPVAVRLPGRRPGLTSTGSRSAPPRGSTPCSRRRSSRASRRQVTLYGRNLPNGQPADGFMVDGRPLEKLTVTITPPTDADAATQLALRDRIEPGDRTSRRLRVRLSRGRTARRTRCRSTSPATRSC